MRDFSGLARAAASAAGTLIAEGELMSNHHVAVWLDHKEAKVFHLSADDLEKSELHAAHHLHHSGRTGGHAETDRKVADEKPYFESIAAQIADAAQILIVGPSTAKTEFKTFLEEHHKPLAAKIVAVEAADHPSDKQIIAHARKHFVASDRLRG